MISKFVRLPALLLYKAPVDLQKVIVLNLGNYLIIKIITAFLCRMSGDAV